MSVSIDCRLDAGHQPLRAAAEAGEWVQVAAGDPDAVARALAGTGAGTVGIVLAGRDVGDLSAPQRSRAGLGVALCRLPPMPTLRVADVLLLGLRAPRPHLWQTLVGSSRARSMIRDDEAQARAVAGRIGVAEWVDAPAVDLPPHVQALTDIARALASVPQALVLRRPAWLPPQTVQDVAMAVRDEQQRTAFAVVELCDEVGPPPPPTGDGATGG